MSLRKSHRAITYPAVLGGVIRKTAKCRRGGVQITLEHAEHRVQRVVDVISLLIVGKGGAGSHDGQPCRVVTTEQCFGRRQRCEGVCCVEYQLQQYLARAWNVGEAGQTAAGI